MSHIYEALEKAEQKRNGYKIIEGEEKSPGIRKEVLSLPSRNFDVPSFPLFQTGSLAAEQFRKLRSTLVKMQPLKTIMVTSALQGEGKTFVSANLAVGIAFDLDLHALLVDGDLRNPSLPGHFGLTPGKGLSDYLKGTDIISDLLNKTKLEKLTLLQGGSISENPAELMSSNRMESLIEEMKTRYSDRYVIFDTTPVLETSEAEVLAKMVDGIILVIRAGKTPRETVQQTIKTLGKEKIIGIVLNQIEFKSSALFSNYFGSNGYYHHYGYGKHGYGKRDQENKKWWGRILSKNRSN
jgi:protein-tyrosine kinase